LCRLFTLLQVAATLWLGMLLSELELLGQFNFCALIYIALFTLPASYLRCR